MALNAQQAFARADKGKGRTVIGWLLDPDQRKELLQQFPPKFSQIIADHVTLAARVGARSELPSEQHGEIVGHIDDGEGVEALVVSIAGSIDRPDGSTYHLTWSLARGRKGKESNDVIARLGWTPIELPMPIRLRPARF
jgi:hypothetical protein